MCARDFLLRALEAFILHTVRLLVKRDDHVCVRRGQCRQGVVHHGLGTRTSTGHSVE